MNKQLAGINSVCRVHQISFGALLTLAHLPLTMTQIAKLNAISTAAATGMIDHLIKSGHVTRGFESPGDRRQITVTASDMGSEVVRMLRAVLTTATSE